MPTALAGCALLIPSERRRATVGRKRPRSTALFGIEDAGRWALARRKPRTIEAGDGLAAPNDQDQVIEHVARSLLKRYGVVFWQLTARDDAWLPAWRDVLRCLRRLEARGEIRGGRFVALI